MRQPENGILRFQAAFTFGWAWAICCFWVCRALELRANCVCSEAARPTANGKQGSLKTVFYAVLASQKLAALVFRLPLVCVFQSTRPISHKPHHPFAAFFQAAFQLQAGEQGLGIGKRGDARLFGGNGKIACDELPDAGDFAV